MSPPIEQTIKHLFRDSKVKRTAELEAAGIHRVKIAQAVKAGSLEKVGRGLYRSPGADISRDHSIAIIAKKSPRGVVCLLSALKFHDLGTQISPEVELGAQL